MLSPLKHLLVLSAICFVFSCGFTPKYQQNPSKLDVRDVLSRIEVQSPNNLLGNHLKAGLEDRFYSDSYPTPAPRYHLETQLDIQEQPFIIEAAGIASRFRLNVRSPYILRRISDGKIIKRGTVRREVSYNVSEQDDYSTFVSSEDARIQGIEALAESYEQALATFFHQHIAKK